MGIKSAMVTRDSNESSFDINNRAEVILLMVMMMIGKQSLT